MFASSRLFLSRASLRFTAPLLARAAVTGAPAAGTGRATRTPTRTPTTASTTTPTPTPAVAATAHEEVFVSNARQSFDAMLSPTLHGSTPPTESDSTDPTLTSNGEEEFTLVAATAAAAGGAACEADATDAGSGDEVTSRSPQRRQPAAVYRTRFAADVAAAAPFSFESKAAFMAAYEPCGINGRPLGGQLAGPLTEAAWANGYASPVWGTRDAFASCRLTIAVADDEAAPAAPTAAREPQGGVAVQDLGRTFVLYNMEQTDVTTVSALISVRTGKLLDPAMAAKWLRDRRFGLVVKGPRLLKPLTMMGEYLPPTVIAALSTHPRFSELQALCPLWITNGQIRQIGMRLADGEENDFAIFPLLYMRHDNVKMVDQELERRSMSKRLGVNLEENSIYYNVHQLADRDRFLQKDPSVDAGGARTYQTDFFGCYGIGGNRMGKTTSFLMREYCCKYNFPTSGIHMWVSEQALLRYGGRPLSTPRTRRDAIPPRRDAYAGAGSLADRDESARSGGESDPGVVPPPFATLLSDGTAVFYNVAHTDIAEQLMAVSTANREKRKDFVRGKFCGGDGQRNGSSTSNGGEVDWQQGRDGRPSYGDRNSNSSGTNRDYSRLPQQEQEREQEQEWERGHHNSNGNHYERPPPQQQGHNRRERYDVRNSNSSGTNRDYSRLPQQEQEREQEQEWERGHHNSNGNHYERPPQQQQGHNGRERYDVRNRNTDSGGNNGDDSRQQERGNGRGDGSYWARPGSEDTRSQNRRH